MSLCLAPGVRFQGVLTEPLIDFSTCLDFLHVGRQYMQEILLHLFSAFLTKAQLGLSMSASMLALQVTIHAGFVPTEGLSHNTHILLSL